jgi:hypothetical protein
MSFTQLEIRPLFWSVGPADQEFKEPIVCIDESVPIGLEAPIRVLKGLFREATSE